MPIDRQKFFDAARTKPFNGRLSDAAVANMDTIITEWERRKLTDLRWLAYMLATVLAECGRNMAPIREVGRGKGHAYGKLVNGHAYYGRGFVQLTWLANYQKMAELTGADLIGNPDLALNPSVATKILFEGMIRGTFTNKKLSDYFNATDEDWKNARRIINSTDRATEIANYGKQFYVALKGAEVAAKPTVSSSGAKKATTSAIVAGTAGAGAAAQAGGFDYWLLIPIIVVGVSIAIVTWLVWPRKDTAKVTQ